MKKYFTLTLMAACASLAFIGCSSNQQASSSMTGTSHSANSGQLIVGRSANFGGITTVLVSIDGTQVATIPRGQKYRGWLAAGKHVVSANIAPNNLNSPEVRKTVEVVAGKTYSFTATWRGDGMALVQNY